MDLPPRSLLGGIPRAGALQAFRESCNTRHTLFVTEKWFAPRRENLLRLLSDPITKNQAQALRDALHQEVQLDEVLRWLVIRRWTGLRWNTWRRLLAHLEERAKRVTFRWKDVEACRRDTELQKQHKLAEMAPPAAEAPIPEPPPIEPELEWLPPQYQAMIRTFQASALSTPSRDSGYTLATLREKTPPCRRCGTGFDQLACFYFTTPQWTWEKLCGRAGWLVVCDRCRVQVKFFLEVMN